MSEAALTFENLQRGIDMLMQPEPMGPRGPERSMVMNRPVYDRAREINGGSHEDLELLVEKVWRRATGRSVTVTILVSDLIPTPGGPTEGIPS